MNNTRILIFIFFLFQQTVFGQVWAGDVNNNGEVNKVDLLYLGYAFGETGAKRTIEGTEWVAFDSPPTWDANFPNGVNFLYADCNGDGMVDELDAEVIIQNIGLSHNDVIFVPDEILIGKEGENPSCKFINPPAAAPVDQIFNLEIGLGDTAIPIESMSGFTFVLDIPDIIKLDNLKFTYNPGSWIEPNEAISIRVEQKDLDKVRLKVAFTKTDRVPVGGSGSLGTVSFLIEGDIVNFFEIDTLTFMLDSIIVLNDELESIPIVPDTLKLAVDKDLKVSTLEHPKLSTIELYPNPNKGLILLKSSESVLERIELINAMGQSIFTKTLNNQTFQSIDFQYLEKGIYWVKVYSDYGIKTQIIHKL